MNKRKRRKGKEGEMGKIKGGREGGSLIKDTNHRAYSFLGFFFFSFFHI